MGEIQQEVFMNKNNINILNIDSALVKISIDLMSEISVKNIMKKKRANQGYVYTLYRKCDNSIKIGYAKNMERKISSIQHAGYILNNFRKGSSKEIEYLKKTLEELGYTEDKNGNMFTLSSGLRSWLIKLNWPIILS